MAFSGIHPIGAPSAVCEAPDFSIPPAAEDVMTNRFLFAAGAAAAVAALAAAPAAFAQDESQSPWTGFYLGATAGGTWGDTSSKMSAAAGNGVVVIPPADIATIGAATSHHNDAGFAGGIEGGYNYQTGNLLLGLETDFNLFDLSQSESNTYNSALLINPPVTFTIDHKVNTDWLWTLRPRIGYATGPWLVYGTGGLATSSVKLKTFYSDTYPTPHTASLVKDETKTGWAAGLGAAYQFTPRWSVKGEWLYVDLGTGKATASDPSGYATFTSQAKARGNIIRVGLDYRF